MRQITRWAPDTCTCVIQYEWDDATNPDDQVHTVYNILSACPLHTGTPDEIFQACLATNQAKNDPPGVTKQAISFISNLFS